MTESGRSWWNGEHGVRAGWRIGTFFILFLFFAFAGQLLTVALPPDGRVAGGVTVTLVAALLAGWTVLIWLDHRPAGALGFALDRAALREIAVGFAIGAVLIGVATGWMALTGAVRWTSQTGTLAGYAFELLRALAFFWVAAAAEEALVRGYPFQALVEGIGAWPAIGLSSLLFSALHGGNPHVGILALANIFLAGVLLAVAYLRTRSLWFATALHAGWNWTMATLLDLPVSGLDAFDTPFYTGRETGVDWWTGGTFGPEAGIAGTVVLLGGTAWLLRAGWLHPSAAMRTRRPIVDRRIGEGGAWG